MSLNLNKVILAGRLATAPEVKQTQSGKAVCNFRLAVTRRFSQGEHPEADFFNIQVWGNTAEFIGKYFAKGGAICITGRIQNRNYTDKEGANRSVTEIVADEANFVESRDYKDPVSHPYDVAGQPAPAPSFAEVKADDDLPF